MTNTSRLVISMKKLAEVDVPKLLKDARKKRAANMTVIEARRYFSDEEIRWIQTFVLVEYSRQRRMFRRWRWLRRLFWEPPVILRGDYDETFGVYSPKRPVYTP